MSEQRYKNWVIFLDENDKPMNMTTKENYNNLISDAIKYFDLEDFETFEDVCAYIDKYL